MQNIQALIEEFGIPGCLAFDEPAAGMPRARVTLPSCTGELYLQGAHLTQWQPTGQHPVLYLSERTFLAPGKAIRGGIPIIFPWFGAAADSPVHPAPGSPSHGYARTRPWQLRFAALAGEELHLSFALDYDDRLHAPGEDPLQVHLNVVFGPVLHLQLTVARSPSVKPADPLLFEEAFHAYLAVADAEQVSVAGLKGTVFLDKTAGFARKTEEEPALRFRSEVDRMYLDTASPVVLMDPVWRRRLTVSKVNSQTTVVWNPGALQAASLPDLPPGGWRKFACVETANANSNARTVRPGEALTMGLHLSVEPMADDPAATEEQSQDRER